MSKLMTDVYKLRFEDSSRSKFWGMVRAILITLPSGWISKMLIHPDGQFPPLLKPNVKSGSPFWLTSLKVYHPGSISPMTSPRENGKLSFMRMALPSDTRNSQSAPEELILSWMTSETYSYPP